MLMKLYKQIVRLIHKKIR